MQLQLAPQTFAKVVPLPTAATPRLASVDVLRGFNIFLILGFDGAVLALDEMLSDKGPVLSSVGHFLRFQFTHAPWDGFRFYDLIFPLLIFVTGVSIVLSLPRLVEREGARAAHLRVLRRALVLYGLGLVFYGGISQHWADVRYVGVLQRIAVCYLFASLLLLNFSLRGMIVAFFALLAGNWAVMTFVPMPGLDAVSFAPDANIANWIDAHVLPGRLWDRTRDPEGLLSTLPAIATCLMGVFAGLFLKSERFSAQEKSLILIAAGIGSAAVGYLWGLQFPVIKAIWTSSFVLVAGGYSLMLLGACHQLIEVWGARPWASVFVWIGANAITLYFLNGIIGFVPVAQRFVGGDLSRWIDTVTATPDTGLFLAHLLGLAFAILLARFLYRRKVFLRI